MESSIITILSQEKNKMMKLEEITKELKVQDTTKLLAVIKNLEETGIIFQGGSDIYHYHFQILNYAINNNIPVLGICMGHQIIGLYSQNTTNDKALIKIPNHNNKEKTHDIKIKPNTILYKIFGPTLTVNSRHNEALSKVNYPFKVSAVSKDNVIEGIEYVDDNHFVLGVQFHPEDLDNTENLYNYFLKEVLKRKK